MYWWHHVQADDSPFGLSIAFYRSTDTLSPMITGASSESVDIRAILHSVFAFERLVWQAFGTTQYARVLGYVCGSSHGTRLTWTFVSVEQCVA
eukprot:m.526979 g.526979  ORF g.526979 m.526979 type:complete len:93 (-) comp22007_c0_seq16:528-806(-)